MINRLKKGLTLSAIVFTIIFTFSCTNNEDGNDANSDKNFVKKSIAKKVAVNWMKASFFDRENFDISNVDSNKWKNNIISYNVEFKEGGFTIVSASFKKVPILAYSNDGSLKEEGDEAEAFLNDHYGKAPEIEDASPESEQNQNSWNKLIGTDDDDSCYIAMDVCYMPVEPFITTKWSQDGGYNPNFTYNNQTPYVTATERAPVGCTAVAFGQVLKYYNYPKRGMSYNRYCSSGNSTYNCYDGEIIEANFNTEYDWENMTESLNYSSSRENIDAVSQLLFHVGAALNARYGEKGTNVQIENPSIFRGFKKHFRMPDIKMIKRADYTFEEWEEIIYDEIFNYRPVILSGYDSSVNAGHAYILNGRDSNGYYHVNWGWGGSANGYYNLKTLTINNRYSFTENLVAFINLTPNIVEEEGRCNGPAGSRCVDGLYCMAKDAVTVIDETESDNYGVCAKGKDDGGDDTVIIEKTIQEKISGMIENEDWIHYGPFQTLEDISVDMTGDGDADLYVRKGSKPNVNDYDCRPYKTSTNENCSLDGAGEYYVAVNGWEIRSNFELTITYKIKEEQTSE